VGLEYGREDWLPTWTSRAGRIFCGVWRCLRLSLRLVSGNWVFTPSLQPALVWIRYVQFSYKAY